MKSRTLSATSLILLAPMIVLAFQAQADQVRGTELKSKSDQTGGAQSLKVTTKLLHTIADGYSYWWSPDSKILAVKHVDKSDKVTVSLYDAGAGKARAVIQVDGSPTEKGVYFTPNSSALVIHTDRVRLYDMADGKLLREFAEGTTPINIYERIFQGHTERANYSDNTSEDVHIGPSNEEDLIELPTRYISHRIISSDGTFLLARGKDGKAQVYDLSAGALKFTLWPSTTLGNKNDQERGALGEFSPDGRLIVTTPAPRLWNASTGDLIADLGPQSDAVYGARFSHDTRFVATTTLDGIVKIWEATTGKLLHTIGSKKEPIYFAVWNPINSSFVTKSRKWEISVWNAETGGLVCKLNNKAIKEKFDENLTFEYSPDGKTLLTKARNSIGVRSFMPFGYKLRLIAHLWDAQTGFLIASLRDNKSHPAEIYLKDDFFWGSTGDFLITAGVSVKMWNRRGELMQELDGNALTSAALSPDGKLLAITDGEPITIGSTYGDMAKILVGKLPNFAPKTYVWQLEGSYR
jgi:WD40 repeat protein